jgi:hypothetical protein
MDKKEEKTKELYAAIACITQFIEKTDIHCTDANKATGKEVEANGHQS